MDQNIIDRIRALNLDPFTEAAVCEIVRDAVDVFAAAEESEKPSTASMLQIPGDWPADYRAQFWARYPRKDEKKKAMAALDKIAFAGKTRWADLLAGIDRYLGTDDVRRGFIKYPATFLNGESWNNEYNGSKGPQSFFEIAAGVG